MGLFKLPGVLDRAWSHMMLDVVASDDAQHDHDIETSPATRVMHPLMLDMRLIRLRPIVSVVGS